MKTYSNVSMTVRMKSKTSADVSPLKNFVDKKSD
jgi:hypothetical protein